ncbi:formate C-acetyltransferase/glycerol dehydratase family glycyl radical enzyme [Lachnospiraceae bacterium ZAX-1]
MTNRVAFLKKLQNDAIPSISAERARLVTEAYSLYAGEPPIRLTAHTLNYVLTHMSLYIQEGELIVGNHTDKPRCAPVYPEFNSEWVIEQIDEFPTRKSDPLKLTAEDRQELLVILEKWKGKSLDKVIEQEIPKSVSYAQESGVITVGNQDCATGHIIADYPAILQKGLHAYKEECLAKMEATVVDSKEKQEQMDFWNAVVITIDAAKAFAERYSRLANELAQKETDAKRKSELYLISNICNKVPYQAPETFREAIQCIWFLHLIVSIESNGHGNSFARFDQYINGFYEKDSARSIITKEEAVELLECFFIKTTDILKLRDKFYSESFAGYPIWQNLVIAGQAADGTDATNAMSHLVLEANADVQTSQPTVSLRYFDGVSPDLMEQGLDMIQQGMSTPAFFNDKLVVPLIMEKFGASLEEARNWAILGCVETGIPGYTDGRPTVGYVNLLKCLELVIHNGINPVNGKRLGVKTGEFKDFNHIVQVQQAFYRQLEYFVELMVCGFNIVGSIHAVRHQMPFASALINDCIKKGKSIQCGGARYSESGAFICGIANTADALSAIETLLYQKKLLTATDLQEALLLNFKGKEEIRQMLLNKAPKYGNDESSVDQMAADILKQYQSILDQYKDSRGANFSAIVESQSLNVSQGKCVQASADGRFAYQPLNDNCSPAMGRDMNGPTAAINSVAKLDQRNAKDGCLYNIRFDPRSVGGIKGKVVLESIIRTYFNHLGEHIQINVVDDKTLRAAQREPEKYRNLLVRVAGYLAYFTELDKEVQDNVIARTTHEV